MAAPTISSISPTSGPATGGTGVVITGTDFTGAATVRFGTIATVFTIDSATRITASAPPGTVGVVSVTVTTPEGTSNSADYTYLVVPVLSSVAPNQGPTIGRTVVTLTGSGLAGVTAVSFGATPAAGFAIVSDTEITATSPAGTGIVTITVTAPGGTSNPVTFVYVILPSVTDISPISGPVAGGNAVTLTGADFVGPLTVRFGAIATVFTIDSTTEITAIAPPGSGIVTVTVTGTGGTGKGVSYSYAGTPVLASVVPSSGSPLGGQAVVLTGTNFAGATAVTFGAVAAISFTVDSTTQISAVTPAGTGTVSVTVTVGDEVSNGVSYAYLSPNIAAIVPDSGPAVGGQAALLTGSNFAGTTAVRFGAVAAASFTVDSATQISAVTPAGTGTVSVTVTVGDEVSNGVPYTYVAPIIATVVPDTGPEIGGQTVVLTGSNFMGAAAVTFGVVAALSFTVDSDTQITADSPAGTGTVLVTVTVGDDISNGVSYTYV
ncbi:IPT/TIG domain-containing protein [Nocardia sp. CNY236]|uniref:IPT/TIG domain-containing protein n=1 Tax=Nocardia sp. CNY236 TaxID=1169152 RepID=UPI000425C4FB|nr:IPT/TIG domain-containing protein [Nocardia sp. CNY236]